jgi:hypothetical protein
MIEKPSPSIKRQKSLKLTFGRSPREIRTSNLRGCIPLVELGRKYSGSHPAHLRDG